MDLLSFDSLIALLTLTSLEIVLGIDNVVVIAVIVGKLKPEERVFTRRLGLFLAMLIRILLLLTLSWLMHLRDPLFSVLNHPLSGRDIILLVGGMFLVGKATFEIHHTVEGDSEQHGKAVQSRGMAIFQILLLDIIFSLDSVITAVGMTDKLPVMITAIVIAVLVMLIFAGTVSKFIELHPTLKMLALSFILLIGVMLVADGLGHHIERGYIYFAMAFSLGVEVLNIISSSKRMRAKKA